MAGTKTVLVTGFPTDVAREQIRLLVAGGDRVLLLVRNKFMPEAQAFAQALQNPGKPEQITLLQGDILELDMGLTGAQVRMLHAEVHEVHHAAAISYLGIQAARMRDVNVEGLREVLEVCLGMRRLERICLWSTAFVAGNRSGIVREDELFVGQQFRNAYEQTKAEAERLARTAMAKLPVTIVRPSILVGDSHSGAVSRLDGPYLLVKAILHAGQTPVPMPGRGDHPLPLVPVDYAARAALFLTRHPDALGGTFHLVDPEPLKAREFYEAVADAANKPRPTLFLPEGLSRAVLNLPGVRNFVRNERTFLDWFDTDVYFDNTRARTLLGPGGIECPPAKSYVDALVRFARDRS
jgi:nucleoside-diphosphate-sugar epimerase